MNKTTLIDFVEANIGHFTITDGKFSVKPESRARVSKHLENIFSEIPELTLDDKTSIDGLSPNLKYKVVPKATFVDDEFANRLITSESLHHHIVVVDVGDHNVLMLTIEEFINAFHCETIQEMSCKLPKEKA